MGNCASNPKTNESEAPVPEPVTEELKVEQQQENNEAQELVAQEPKPEEMPVSSDDNTLATLLNQNGEKKDEQVEAKEEPKTQEVKVEAIQEEKPKPEEPKPAQPTA